VPGAPFIADRLLNRFWDYPRAARQQAKKFPYVFVCDHTYAHLVLEFPPGAGSIVQCHDLDALRPLLHPGYSPAHRWIATRVLRGLQAATRIAYGSGAVGEELRKTGWFRPERLVQLPYGLCSEFTPSPANPENFIMHVGSCIPRKNIEFLLDVCAQIFAKKPELRLLQIGGQFTPAQRERISRLGIAAQVEQRRGLPREELANLYRRARLVLQPSLSEGFGLPAIEALASGARLICSDLPSHRENVGQAAVLLPATETGNWVKSALEWLESPGSGPDPLAADLARFRWENFVDRLLREFRGLGMK
jgi:glycosyltransferase involved in cell wall biosynthesis